MRVIKNMFIVSIVLLYTGCAFKITSSGIEQIEEKEKRVFPCEKEAKKKSLQFLEQQYRCTSHEEKEK